MRRFSSTQLSQTAGQIPHRSSWRNESEGAVKLSMHTHTRAHSHTHTATFHVIRSHRPTERLPPPPNVQRRDVAVVTWSWSHGSHKDLLWQSVKPARETLSGTHSLTGLTAESDSRVLFTANLSQSGASQSSFRPVHVRARAPEVRGRTFRCAT